MTKLLNYLDFDKFRGDFISTATHISNQLTCQKDGTTGEKVLAECTTDLLPCLLVMNEVANRNLHASVDHGKDLADILKIAKSIAIPLLELDTWMHKPLATSKSFRMTCDVFCSIFSLEKLIGQQKNEPTLFHKTIEMFYASLLTPWRCVKNVEPHGHFVLDQLVEFLCQITETPERLDVFNHFVNSDLELRENSFPGLKTTLLSTLDRCSDQTACKILLELFKKWMDTEYHSELEDTQRQVWGSHVWMSVSNPCTDFSRAFTILGCTADYIFSERAVDSEFGQPLWLCERFWQMLQNGLADDNPLHRKQSLYFMKRAIDCVLADPSLRANPSKLGKYFGLNDRHDVLVVTQKLNDMMLIVESLEEKQVHILKPLFPLIRSLRAETDLVYTCPITGQDKHWILPSQWLMTVYQRMLKHDSKTIRIWAVEDICSLDLSIFPLRGQEIWDLYLVDLLMTLNDSSLYTRLESDPVGSSSNLGNRLADLFQSLHDATPSHDARAMFFMRLLRNIQAKMWSELPLLEIFRALHLLTGSSLWNLDALEYFKDIFSKCLRTHDVFLRGATQVFMLKSLINLLDVKEITFHDLSHVLVLFKSDECLKRGTELWDKTTLWICSMMASKESSNISIDAAKQFIDSSFQILLKQPASPSEHAECQEILRTARMVALLVDASYYVELSELRLVVNPLMETLIGCYSRPYMCLNKPECCLWFLLTLSTEVNSIKLDVESARLERSMFLLWEELLLHVMPFVDQQLFKAERALSDLEAYFSLLEYLVRVTTPHELAFLPYLQLICKSSLTSFAEMTHCANHRGKHIAARCFGILCMLKESVLKGVVDADHLEKFIELAAGDIDISSAGNKQSHVSKSFADATHGHNPNRASSEYTTIIWSCVAIYLRTTPTTKKANFYVDSGLHALEIGGHVCLRPVFNCFRIILPELVVGDPDTVIEVLAICWKTMFDMKHNSIFWDAMDAFVDAAFQPIFMSDQHLFPHLTQYVARIRELSESMHGLFLPLVKKVCCQWRSDPSSLSSSLIGVQLLVEALTFGNIHRKDVRIMRDAAAFISSLGDQCSVNQLVQSNHQYDVEVRVEAITLLLEIGCSEVDWHSILEPLIRQLVDHERGVTATRSRHFANSLIHRVKQRVWQAVLLLEPFCAPDLDGWLLDHVFRQLIEEGLQPSVRYQMEWLAVRIMFRRVLLRASFFDVFQKAAKNRVGSLGSFFSIVAHLGCVLKVREDQVDLIGKAIPVVLPWCMAQNFNTRIYAQAAVHKLWKFCKNERLFEITNVYVAMECLLLANTESGGSARGVGKLLEEYYFYGFHPLNHYSVETIFHDFPRFSGISEEEWVHPTVFQNRALFQSSPATLLPLKNVDDSLSRCTVGSWTVRTRDQAADSPEIIKDVQRKTTPWKQMIPDFQAMSLSSEFVSNKKRSNVDGMIVVASLIDKAPNLGGLCRTCEVFGVTKYILGSLRYTEDQQFRNLSVSAENWVVVEEVKPRDLGDYLLQMKKSGYTIMGAEQTLNSRKLNKCEFPKKTVLLLGNEKEGIPVELIQLLDVCVEIPQQGLIRSLNVHVSGALLIWEYARQHSIEPSHGVDCDILKLNPSVQSIGCSL